MIFDCDTVSQLVLEFQRNPDEEVLADILEKSRRLVEAIVSSYDSTFRDDLIQESYLKIQNAIQFFNPNISSLHNYFTTIIRNCCITFSKKNTKELVVDFGEEFILIGEDSCDDTDYHETLHELVVRNRTRFPSILCDDIDEMTEHIFFMLQDRAKSNHVISSIVEIFDVPRSVASTIYHSTLIYLRGKYRDFADINMIRNPDEFSVANDLKELIGDNAYSRISILFSGMCIRIR